MVKTAPDERVSDWRYRYLTILAIGSRRRMTSKKAFSLASSRGDNFANSKTKAARKERARSAHHSGRKSTSKLILLESRDFSYAGRAKSALEKPHILPIYLKVPLHFSQRHFLRWTPHIGRKCAIGEFSAIS